MASHVLAPPLQLDAPWVRVKILLATLVVSALGVAGFAVALTLPAAQPAPPAHFQGDIP